MDAAPVLGDVAPGADPYAVFCSDVVEKADKPGDPPGAADDPVMHSEGHHLWPVFALGVKRLKTVDHIAGKIVTGRKPPVLVKAVVVGLKRIGDDKLAVAPDRHPIRQLVAKAVAVVEKPAEFEMETAR